MTRRPGEVVARYGGEEFIAILPYTTPEEAQKYSERLCLHVQGLDIAHNYSTTAPNVTISAGATSQVPKEGSSAQQLIKAADEALYQAKSEGRNRSRFVQ